MQTLRRFEMSPGRDYQACSVSKSHRSNHRRVVNQQFYKERPKLFGEIFNICSLSARKTRVRPASNGSYQR